MRHTVKGAAAFAALCAGALALSPMAYATPAPVYPDVTNVEVPGLISANRAEFGGGADHQTSATAAWIGRISGIDRTQTSLESYASTSKAHKAKVANVFVVEQGSTVDALTLAPLAKRLLTDNKGLSAVIYSKTNGLTSAAIDKLNEADKMYGGSANYFLIGGFAKLSTAVDQQLGSPIYNSVKNPGMTYRLDGSDRYETAYLVSGLVIGGQAVWNAAADYGRAVVAKADFDRALREWVAADTKGDELAKAAQAAKVAYDEAAKKLADNTKIFDEADLVAARKAVTTAQAAEEVAKKANDVCLSKNGKTEAGNVPCIVEQAAYSAAQKASGAAAVKLNDLLMKKAKVDASMPTFKKLGEEASKLKKALKDAEKTEGTHLKDKLDKATKNIAAAAHYGKCYIESYDPKTAVFTLDKCVGTGKTLLTKERNAFINAVDDAWRGYGAKVFLATGTDFADALVVGPAAAKLGAPVLLTKGSSYQPTVRALGKGNGMKKIYAAGGPAVKAAKDLVATKMYHSTIALDGKALWVGADRYETAYKLAVSFYLGKETAHKNFNRDMVLASGVVGADAVVAGVWCVSDIYAGILLTRPDSLPTVTADYISFGDKAGAQQGAVKNLVIFGGFKAISHDVAGNAWTYMGQ